MTQLIYKELETTMAEVTSKVIQRTDPDGLIWFIPIDEANSDYQRYLRWVENPDAEEANYLTLPAILESTQPDEADLTEGTN
jgi:hypothetical protein